MATTAPSTPPFRVPAGTVGLYDEDLSTYAVRIGTTNYSEVAPAAMTTLGDYIQRAMACYGVVLRGGGR